MSGVSCTIARGTWTCCDVSGGRLWRKARSATPATAPSCAVRLRKSRRWRFDMARSFSLGIRAIESFEILRVFLAAAIDEKGTEAEHKVRYADHHVDALIHRFGKVVLIRQ